MIRQEIKFFSDKIESNFEVLNDTLESILTKVNALESDTDIIRIFKKYKWFLAIFALGIYQMFKIIDIQKWVNMIF